jgi:hypothetical protein
MNKLAFLRFLESRTGPGDRIQEGSRRIAGGSYTLLGAAVLFLTSLLLARRLSINFAGNLEERFSGVLARTVEPEAVTSIALTNELLAV